MTLGGEELDQKLGFPARRLGEVQRRKAWVRKRDGHPSPVSSPAS